MAIRLTSFLIPASPAIPFLLDDNYIGGGYRCVPDEAARDAINRFGRKAGMRVYVESTEETWTVAPGDVDTWVKVPSAAERNQHVFTAGSAIAADGSLDFTIATGKTALILKVEVSHADLTVEGHTAPARADVNPYKFVSYTGHLIDDGSSKLEDSTTQYNRRFGIISNLENTPSVNTYWRVVNDGVASATPTITITYLAIEG